VRVGSFVYRAEDLKSGGTEHEFDSVMVGHARDDVVVKPHPAEIDDWQWIEVSMLKDDLSLRPRRYAPWLEEGLRLAIAHIQPES
jgi:isopentenyl-diphosphate delta-isomerase